MTISGEPSTPRERAEHIANLMGGNGLSQTQQVALIAAKLVQWSRSDCFEAAGIADPCNGKTPQQVIEPLVWYRGDGWQHGGMAETWKDRAQELDKRETDVIKAMMDMQKAVGDDDRVPHETYQRTMDIIAAWEAIE